MKVSVLMITYNHEKFISYALDSILMQSVSFDYEIVIGEDCSTDRTREIIAEYKKRHPEKIRVLISDENMGMMKNYARTFRACNGQYIAVLDGDDYWNSKYKLQKQVDFLDNHPHCSACFHKVKTIYDESEETTDFGTTHEKNIFTLKDLLHRNFIANCSVMYRAGIIENFPDWWYSIEMTDWTTHILYAQHGDIGYLNEELGVYRIHSKGIWSMRGNIINLQEEIKVYENVNPHLNFAFDKELRNIISKSFYRLALLYNESNNLKMARYYAIKSLRKSLYFYRNRRVPDQVDSLSKLKLAIRLYFPSFYKVMRNTSILVAKYL